MFLHVTLTPEWKNDTISAMSVRIQTDRTVQKGQAAFARITEYVKIPFCPIEGRPKLTDDRGIVPYDACDAQPDRSFSTREELIVCRDTEGSLSLSYRILPRLQPPGYRSSPYLDFVAEKGGASGSGETILFSLPDITNDTLKFDFILDWDLAGLPAGARGLYAYSAADHFEMPETDDRHVLQALYACGCMHSYEEGGIGFYWFDQLPFDGEKSGRLIVTMFRIMQKAFHDQGGPYRVMTRHNGFPGSGGGTAYNRSYIYSYCDGQVIREKDLRSLMSHEMVHNWPCMKDEPAGLGTWYGEGCAEYFSTMILLENNLSTLGEIADDINEKAGSYYKNPLMNLSNMELGKIYWQDLRAQRLPYHRGMLYLSNLDAQIKRFSRGKKCLLDLSNELMKIPEPTPDDFIRVGKEFLHMDLESGYRAMCNGGFIEPDPDAFDGLFTVKRIKVRQDNSQHRWEHDQSGPLVDGFIWEPKRDADSF